MTATATHTSGGAYTVTFTGPTVGGNYIVKITMTNDFTDNNANEPTELYYCETILIVDDRSVPAASTVTEPTGPFTLGNAITYTIQTKSIDGTDQDNNADDNVTVKITCKEDNQCKDTEFSVVAAHQSGGLFRA